MIIDTNKFSVNLEEEIKRIKAWKDIHFNV